MKLKYDFVVNKVADKTIAVAVGGNAADFNGFVKLNDTAAFMFNLMDKDTAVETMVSALKKEYPNATEEEVQEALDSFLEQLKENGLLA